jgi:hypothetical protein
MPKKYKSTTHKPATFETFLQGQRKINGSFYEAMDYILDALGKAKGLEEARRIVDAVPGIDPPGCDPSGPGKK